MTLLIEDAARLWKEIPTDRLGEAVEAAIVEAGAFLATAGLVAKLWAGRKPKEAQADFHNIKGQMDNFPALPPPETREMLRRLAQQTRAALGPGSRPKDWEP